MVFWGYVVIVLIIYTQIMVSYIVAFWSYQEGVIITIFYIAAAAVVYQSVVKKVMAGIEQGNITGNITIDINSLLAVSATGAFLTLSKLRKK